MRFYFRIMVMALVGALGAGCGLAAPVPREAPPFPPPVESYQDEASNNLETMLLGRIKTEPFNLIATVIFVLALVHTFLAPWFTHLSHLAKRENDERLLQTHGPDFREQLSKRQRQSMKAAMLHFLGEVEVVFGLWVIPLALLLWAIKGATITRVYLNVTVNYVEPLFVVVIMAIAASRPVVQAAMRLMRLLAGSSVVRWWWVLLTLGPLLGSLITEPAAMTICALLLGREFYERKPSVTLCYATLGLLFVNISVGGTLTNFAAPPVLIVAAKWHWSTLHMLTEFGWKAVLGIILSNLAYFLFFFREMIALEAKAPQTDAAVKPEEETVPIWITGVHVFFLFWTVLVAHEPALFIGGFLFFLAFTMATTAYQDEISLRSPILVGFFLAGLVVHGGLQGWWIEPVLGQFNEFTLLFGAAFLTAFNDNAAITYLASLVPEFTDPLKYAVMAGAISGGGLTVIANAPNPAGQSLLQRYFPENKIGAGGLMLSAAFPTAVMLVIFAITG